MMPVTQTVSHTQANQAQARVFKAVGEHSSPVWYVIEDDYGTPILIEPITQIRADMIAAAQCRIVSGMRIKAFKRSAVHGAAPERFHEDTIEIRSEERRVGKECLE